MTTRPLPAVTAESVAHWTGGAVGELRIHRCAGCARRFHPPAPLCPHCLGRDVAAEPVSGRATIVSFTVNHHPWSPGLEVPYVVAYVALREDPEVWLMTNIVGCPVEAVSVGLPVRVVFERDGDVWIPLFERDAP